MSFLGTDQNLQFLLYALGTTMESSTVGAPLSARWTGRPAGWQPAYRGEGDAPTRGSQRIKRRRTHRV